MNLTALFDEAIHKKASDIHLATGEYPHLRISGDLVRIESSQLDRHGMANLLEPCLPPEARIRLESGMAVEKTIVHGELGFAGIIFRCGDDGIAATFRILPNQIPALDTIGEDALPLFQRIVTTPRGLVLIVGPTGSGKWTVAGSIADAINISKPARIFIVSAHPSFRFESKRSLVTDLHVGQDCESYQRALEIAHHSDLDVVAVDDIPTPEALRQALILAETGHLVIANMTADNSIDALQRLFDAAGSEVGALRRSLAQNLVVVTAQRLFPRAEGKGRVPAYEWLTATEQVRAAILTGDLERLEEIRRSDSECRSLDAAIDHLVTTGRVSEEKVSAYRSGG